MKMKVVNSPHKGPMPMLARTRFLWRTLMVLMIAGGAGEAGAAEPTATGKDTAAKKASTPVAYCSIFWDRGEAPILVVEYPWKVHPHASLEVCLLPNDVESVRKVEPLFFRANYFKDDVARTFHELCNRAEERNESHAFQFAGMNLELIARRNLLERPAVYAIRRFKQDKEKQAPLPGATAAFCLLDAWTLGDKLLYIDLPRSDFARSGKLRVWLLRDAHILWEQTLTWPGLPKK
jgi:hypothetical protein